MNISWNAARRWISGNRLSCAIRETRRLNKRGIGALINFLGENITDRKEAERIFLEYRRIIKEIKSQRLNAAISTKPTQFCLHPHSQYCSATLARLLDIAKKERVFVWFDMERSMRVQETIDLYLALLKTYKNIGICIQAYLKRSRKDTERIIKAGGIVRLVKGAYQEKKAAYTKKGDIDRNFLRLMRILFRRSRRFALGTHDGKIIDAAVTLNKKYRRDVEFQTLYGVRREIVRELAGKEHVSVYVPYGRSWDNYIERRLREKARWK